MLRRACGEEEKARRGEGPPTARFFAPRPELRSRSRARAPVARGSVTACSQNTHHHRKPSRTLPPASARLSLSSSSSPYGDAAVGRDTAKEKKDGEGEKDVEEEEEDGRGGAEDRIGGRELGTVWVEDGVTIQDLGGLGDYGGGRRYREKRRKAGTQMKKRKRCLA